jgi:hypothetical protein
LKYWAPHNGQAKWVSHSEGIVHQGLAGLDVSDLDLSYDLLESLTSSSAAFQEFMGQHWDQVLHSAFVHQV